MPYFAWRLSVSPMIDKRLEQMSPDEVYARLRRFWYDNALAPTARDLRMPQAGVAQPGQIVFGSDWPFANSRASLPRRCETYEGVAMPQEQRDAIDRRQCLVAFPAVRLTV